MIDDEEDDDNDEVDKVELHSRKERTKWLLCALELVVAVVEE